MKVIKAYTTKNVELTKSQKDFFNAEVKKFKLIGFDYFYVNAYVCSITGLTSIEYVTYSAAKNYSVSATVGKKGTQYKIDGTKGCDYTDGNNIEKVIEQLEVHKAYTVEM